MAICPFARWRPLASHGGFMSAHLGAVEHVTTNHADPFGFFSDPAHQASSHFWIADDGTLDQYVDTDYASWAQAAGNGQYVSVETAGTPDTPLTAPQVNTFGAVYAWGSRLYGWPMALAERPGQRGLGWHGMGGQDWGSHFGCPGDIRKAQRPAVLATAVAILAPPPPPIPPEVDAMPISTSLRPDQVDTFDTDATGRLVHRWYVGKGPWEDEVLAVGLVPFTQLAGPISYHGAQHLFGRRADGGQGHIWWDGSAWNSDTQPALA